MKYEYKKVKGCDQKKFIENGHTMFEEDVLQRLKRLAYLEEQLQQANGSNTENEKALPINIVRVCAWDDAADIDKLPLLEKAAELAGDSMFCMRVWSAWGVGTMTENDFVDAAEDDDFVNDIAKAIWEGH
jgi:hypothetical protein